MVYRFYAPMPKTKPIYIIHITTFCQQIHKICPNTSPPRCIGTHKNTIPVSSLVALRWLRVLLGVSAELRLGGVGSSGEILEGGVDGVAGLDVGVPGLLFVVSTIPIK
jgi:hypothetical protein